MPLTNINQLIQFLISCNPYSIGFRVVPVVARYEELMFPYIMEYTDNQIIDLILESAYSVGGYLRFTPTIINKRGINFDKDDCERFAELISTLGICDVSHSQNEPLIRITAKGIEMIQLHHGYSKYLESKKMDNRVDAEIKMLTKKNIRLKNMNIVVGIISFIVGFLLSDPIKNILKQWLVGDL